MYCSTSLIVLGMHRSGSSALMRILNLLGVEIGSQLLPKHHTNEKGFWEWLPLVQGNEKILRCFNSSWFNPQALPEQWWQSTRLRSLALELTDILHKNFAAHPLWGIKDPRLCRLLPFWIPLIEKLGSQPHFIFIVRHPQEVAASLKQRDNLAYPTALRLWLSSMFEAEQATQNYPRVVITYDELLNHWPTAIDKIASTLNITWPCPVEQAAPHIYQFLSSSLKHHQASVHPSYEGLVSWSHRVYHALTSHDPWNQLASLREEFNPHSPDRMIQNTRLPKVHFHFLIQLSKESDEFLLNTTLTTLRTQSYAHWTLTVIANFKQNCTYDQAVHWVQGTFEHCLSREINQVDSDWVGLLQVGAELSSELLTIVVQYVINHSHWQLIYVDEDVRSPFGECYAPQFKPALNLDLLRSTPYLGNLVLVQRGAFPTLERFVNLGLANYEMTLKVLDCHGEQSIGHIAQILYHGPLHENFDFAEVTRILRQHLQRRHLSGEIYETDVPHIFYTEYALETLPWVSIIIATKGESPDLQRCLESLLTLTHYPHYEVLLVTNTPNLWQGNTSSVRILYHENDELSKMNNFAAQQARGSILVFLNDATEIIQADWLQALLIHQQRPEVGMVGARILDTHHRLLHAGLILGMGEWGIAGHPYQGLGHDEPGYLGRAQAVQNFHAISDNGMMIDKALYLKVGGMNAQLQVFNEVDLCLKVTQQAYKIVWTPFATLIQHGPGSLAHSVHRQELDQETAFMYEQWMPYLSHDPAYHPHLCLNGTPWQADSHLQVPWDCNIHERPRVVAFPFDSWGCGEYRVRSPLRALHEAGFLEYALMPNDQEKRIPTPTELARMGPDSLLLHNPFHDPYLQAIPHYRNCFKILSQDDLLYALPQSNPYHHRSYKDIKSRILTALSHCERLIVSTEPLAQAYQYVANDIHVVPNYLEKRRWGSLTSQRRVGRKPRVGWAGAAQHQGDLELIIPLIQSLAKEVEWVFFGLCPSGLRSDIHEYYPMVSFEQYPAQLARLNLDLALAPLENNAFNEAKSNLRLLEYGILGWPVVCSAIYPYQEAPVTHVQNTPSAWIEAVRTHIDDLENTARAGDRLRKWVLDHWMLEDHLPRWAQALNVMPKKKVSSQKSKQKQWIFILGSDSTSTHLVEELLCQHPAITGLTDRQDESKFFDERNRFPTSLAQQKIIPQLWTEQEMIFRLMRTEKTHQSNLLKKAWFNLLEKADAPFIVQRSATHSAKALWLQHHFPDAYFIHVVRNGYQVALELVENIEKKHQALLLHRAAQHWARSLEIFLEEASQLHHVSEIHYEDLMFPSTIEKLFSFLSLSSIGLLPPEPLSAREVMIEQKAVIEQSARSMLSHYGYTKSCLL